MIVALISFALAALAGTATWRAMQPVFAHPVFTRTNYRGRPLPTAVGVVIPVVTVALVAIGVLVYGPWRSWSTGRWFGLDPLVATASRVVALTAGFALLGLLDDLAGEGESGGFVGHIRALAHGRLTTGAVKLFGGAATAVAVLGAGGGLTGFALLRDAALVCLAANLANLFDRAPGRTIKIGLLGLVVLAVVARDGRITPIAIPIGASAGLLGGDLREEFMVGDAGSNAIGAACGLGVILVASEGWRWIVLGLLLALNLASEVVSFSSVIERVPVLRRADRLGSPHRN